MCLPVHCLSAPPDRQLYCHTNAISHSLLKHDQIACDNRLPVHCRRATWRRHGAVLPVATQMSLALVQGGPGSVRFGYGLGKERFKRFRFSVLAVPLQKRCFCVSVEFNRQGRFQFRFRFLENGSGGFGSAFGFRKNGSDGSGFRFRFGS